MGPLAIAGIGAGIKGLTSLLSSNPLEEAKERMLKALNQEEADLKAETDRNKRTVRLTADTSKKQRRGIATQVNEGRGVDDPTAIFSNEEDIINAEMQGLTDLDAQLQNAMNDIRRRRMEVESMDTGPNALERGIGGALEGANLGFDVAGALGMMNPKSLNDPLKALPTIPEGIGTTGTGLTEGINNTGITDNGDLLSSDIGDLSLSNGNKKKSKLFSGDLLGISDMNTGSILPKMNYKNSLLRLRK